MYKVPLMTVKQMKKACAENNYILARFPSGYRMGINCKISEIAQKRKKYKNSDLTDFISYMPCDFNTYLSYKHRF